MYPAPAPPGRAAQPYRPADAEDEGGNAQQGRAEAGRDAPCQPGEVCHVPGEVCHVGRDLVHAGGDRIGPLELLVGPVDRGVRVLDQGAGAVAVVGHDPVGVRNQPGEPEQHEHDGAHSHSEEPRRDEGRELPGAHRLLRFWSAAWSVTRTTLSPEYRGTRTEPGAARAV